MIEVQSSIDVDRTPVEVFDFLADFSNNAAWQAGVTRCTETSPPPVGQGSTFLQEGFVLGRRSTTPVEVIEFEPDYRIRTKAAGGSIAIEVIREVSRRADGKAKVRSTVRAEPQGWFMVLAFAVRWGLRSVVRGDCRRLARLLAQDNPTL